MKKIFSVLIVFAFSLQAQNVHVLEEGPIHDAFISHEYGELILLSVQKQPPAPIQEKAGGEPPHSSMEWIGGYWEWSERVQDFVWVTGIWRDRPPGCQWIAGRWIASDEGWVRVPGFWSRVSEGEITYLPRPPPDSLDEEIPRIPAINCFWILGCWEFDPIHKRYDWRQGRWQLYDDHWVYMPGHYLWRPEGYIFVAGYWDYPFEERGSCFATVMIDPEVRETIVYEPTTLVDPAMIIVTLFPYWPNYLQFFHTFTYYHPEFWRDWQVEVPWWKWEEWWCFTWKDQLALWWWWSHPGSAQPAWMTPRLAQLITPPSKGVVNLMRTKEELPNMTKAGVVGDEVILQAVEWISKKKEPILSDALEKEVDKRVAQIEIKRPFLLPTASAGPEEDVKKPFFGPKEERLSHAPKRVLVPEIPPVRKKEIAESHPKIFKKERPVFPHSNVDDIEWPESKMPEFPHSNKDREEKEPEW